MAVEGTEQTHAGRTLTHQTSRGFSWMLMQTIGAKPITLLGQLLLAKLLLNDQWGLVGLAFSVSVWAELLQQAGIREILVRRHQQFDQWANPAFWMALTTAALGGALLLAAAPLAAMFYDAAALPGLLYVLALSLPASGLGVVPNAKLQVQLRFRGIAAILFVTSLVQIALSILLAVVLPAELGAYSFVWPFTISAALKSAAAWWLAPASIHWNPQLAMWRGMFGDSARLFAGSVFLWITNMAGIVVLGRVHDEAVVGNLYFALLISGQVSVLESNLQHVLLPSLSRLQHEPARMRAAFMRAMRGIVLLGAPLAVMLAAMADPALRAVFNEKWLGAILPLQLLSIGVAMRMTSLSSVALMKANGRFTSFVVLYAMWSVVYTGLAIYAVLAIRDGAAGVAWATLVFYCLLGPVNTYVAARPLGGRWSDVLGVFAAPMMVSLASFGAAMGLASLLPQFAGRDIVRVLVIVVIGAPLCMAALCRFAPQTLAELLGQIEHMARRSARALRVLALIRTMAAAIHPRSRAVFLPAPPVEVDGRSMIDDGRSVIGPLP
jgi:O-antigen/teichoic acid export membrane protein